MTETRAQQPMSFCRCTHSGDGPGSEHEDRFTAGHGPCKRCDCRQFTWKGWTPYGDILANAVRRERAKGGRR